MPITRWSALALLGLGYTLALWHGRLEPAALGAVALLIVAGLAVQPARPTWCRRCGHGLFVATALGLALHKLPGFDNTPIMALTQASAQSTPFISYLNLDKPLIGFWLLLACPWLWQTAETGRSPRVSLAAVLLTPVLCLGLACLLGITAWDPKWPAYAPLWLVNNLLLVCLTEELLFRAYLQGALQHGCHRWPLKGILPVGISALSFGLAHIGAGWAWVLLGSLAGLGYGIAWQRGGLWAAVIGHFALNLAHFTLFAYPMLQQ